MPHTQREPGYNCPCLRTSYPCLWTRRVVHRLGDLLTRVGGNATFDPSTLLTFRRLAVGVESGRFNSHNVALKRVACTRWQLRGPK